MSRRTQRVGNLIRQTLGEVLLSRLSDPRIDPARTSVTRVEIPEDLLTAKVYVSVLGTEADENRVLRALRHAAGHVQELMARQISLRHTPVLSFELDSRFKKALQTYEIIDRAMDEIRRKDGDRDGQAAEQHAADPDETPAPDASSREAGSN